VAKPRLFGACGLNGVVSNEGMPIDAFLFLQPSDIAHFVAMQPQLAGVKRLFIDPGLVESAVSQGVELDDFEYRALDVGPHFQARVATEAATRAATLDQALCRERQALFPGATLQGWDQSLLRQFFIRVLLFRSLGEVCERSFGERRVGLLRPRNPQLFYFDACVAVDVFMGTSLRWQVIGHYAEAKHWKADCNTRCFDFAGVRALAQAGRAQAVTHIPTTYRHLKDYERQITAAFATSIDLPAAFWDLPVGREAELLQPLDQVPAEFSTPQALLYRERARTVLHEHLRELIPTRAALDAQVALFAERCHLQAVNYVGLARSLAGTRPHFVLTDHDTGHNGPLFSVAAELGSRITVLPHSSYATGAIPHSLNVEVVERDGFMTPMRTVWGERIRTRGVRLGTTSLRRPRTRVRRVCMLVNGMVSNGLFYIDFVGMVAFYKALAVLCEVRDVELLMRLKPTASGVGMVAGALGTSVEALEAVLKPSIEEIADAADLCVSFGQPTTGTISFLASGCYLLHASELLWPTDYASSPAYFSDSTVDCVSSAEALQRINALISSPTHFAEVAARQFADFERRLDRGSGLIFDAA
jgi:hypothetical protein